MKAYKYFYLALIAHTSAATDDWPTFINSCNNKLGLSNWAIPNDQITASSKHFSKVYQTYWHPKWARLDYVPAWPLTNAWMPNLDQPNFDLKNEYLQIDLGSLKVLTGIATQGTEMYFRKSYISRFKIETSKDGKTWSTVQKWSSNNNSNSNSNSRKNRKNRAKYHQSLVRTESKTDQIFYGDDFLNGDSENQVSMSLFPGVLIGRFIRFRPVEYKNHPILKMELYGCDYDYNKISLPKGKNTVFESRRITYDMRHS